MIFHHSERWSAVFVDAMISPSMKLIWGADTAFAMDGYRKGGIAIVLTEV
jgi:hypothetical protein